MRKSAGKLASAQVFYGRIIRFLTYAFLVIIISLLIGICGYHFYGNLGWIDSLVNASMILTGMGPVDRLQSTGGKIFESFYAIYSGVVFLSTIAVLIAPLIHRF